MTEATGGTINPISPSSSVNGGPLLVNIYVNVMDKFLGIVFFERGDFAIVVVVDADADVVAVAVAVAVAVVVVVLLPLILLLVVSD